MEVNVNMSAEEFLEFMAWKRDREQYNNEMAARAEKMELLAKKTCWAIEKDPKRPARSRSWIRNTRRSCWSWPMITYHKKKTTCARC